MNDGWLELCAAGDIAKQDIWRFDYEDRSPAKTRMHE
jgi:hypothetical protein